jgi:hypothetical protein
MPVIERDPVSLNASVPDPELRRFAREQARELFSGRLSNYIVFLLELDRDEGVARKELLRRLSATVEEREAIPA